uniref:Uncharacterized protein n=1 Tax=viral metagenome TaxID=1070528 RepID=A0A6M3J448_9ZZZZ
MGFKQKYTLTIDDLTVKVKIKKMPITLHFPEVHLFGVKEDETLVGPLTSRTGYFSKITGEDFGTSQAVGRRTDNVDSEGNVYDKEHTVSQTEDGKGGWKPAKQYSNTGKIEGMVGPEKKWMEIPIPIISDWQAEKVFEVYVDAKEYKDPQERRLMEALLFEKVKQWWDRDVAVVGQFVPISVPAGMILQPIIKNEDGEVKFVIKMIQSKTKTEKYQHLMTVTQKPQEIKILEEPDTEQVLAMFAT